LFGFGRRSVLFGFGVVVADVAVALADETARSEVFKGLPEMKDSIEMELDPFLE
jgi:hypothetical protein